MGHGSFLPIFGPFTIVPEAFCVLAKVLSLLLCRDLIPHRKIVVTSQPLPLPYIIEASLGRSRSSQPYHSSIVSIGFSYPFKLSLIPSKNPGHNRDLGVKSLSQFLPRFPQSPELGWKGSSHRCLSRSENNQTTVLLSSARPVPHRKPSYARSLIMPYLSILFFQ